MIERFVRGFRSLQRFERRFRRISHVDRDIPTMYGELQKEGFELGEAIKRGDPWEIRCEMADMAINLAEMANSGGFDLSRDVRNKLRRNADKYSPRALRRLQRDWGFTPMEAMAFAKDHWNRERDKQYFTS